MSDRIVHMILIHDPNSAASREMMETITETMDVDTIELQRVQRILPGIRAVPAVGVLFWASDLQGLATDIEQFASYIANEDVILEALAVQGVSTDEE